MTAGELVVVSVGVLVASAVQGALGLGFAFVLVPVLGVVAPTTLPATVICLGLPLTALVAYRERREIDLAGLKWLLPGRVVGTAMGVGVLMALPQQPLQILFGALVVLAAPLTAVGPTIPLRGRTQLGVGTLSGLMGTTVALGGPALGILYSKRPSGELRSTLGITLALGTVISLVGLAVAGQFAFPHVTTALWLVPAMVIGLRVSSVVVRRLPERVMYAAVLTFAVVAGVVMALQG